MNKPSLSFFHTFMFFLIFCEVFLSLMAHCIIEKQKHIKEQNHG